MAALVGALAAKTALACPDKRREIRVPAASGRERCPLGRSAPSDMTLAVALLATQAARALDDLGERTWRSMTLGWC
jgi:hypothetical protein